MLEYALSRYQKRRLSKRILASWIVSCFWHFLMLGALIQYPQLLQGGMYHRFRALTVVGEMLAPTSEDDDRDWRTVAVLRNRPMAAPSSATLRKYAYDWNKKGTEAPPVQVRWGDEQKAALVEGAAPIPRIKQAQLQPPPPLPVGEVAAAYSAPSSSERSTAANQGSGSSANAAQLESAGKSTLYLPPPGPDTKQKSEMADNVAPSSIPSTKPGDGSSNLQRNQSRPDPAARIFENEQQALRSPEGGLFDTKGFPLGEYANLIIERIKGKWFIPSNLRNAQGHTTVVFFIDKEGRFTDARIVMSSGSESLDLAALNAVMSSNPFPPLPKGFPGERVGAKFIFSYNEPQ
jgi:TonB family protein